MILRSSLLRSTPEGVITDLTAPDGSPLTLRWSWDRCHDFLDTACELLSPCCSERVTPRGLTAEGISYDTSGCRCSACGELCGDGQWMVLLHRELEAEGEALTPWRVWHLGLLEDQSATLSPLEEELYRNSTSDFIERMVNFLYSFPPVEELQRWEGGGQWTLT